MGGKLLREADKVAGDILKDFREILIFIGRLLLVATFVEDGYRMWHQWKGGEKMITSNIFMNIDYGAHS